MKIRIKFGKYNELRFIGHLDVMRYFQKVMRRADIDIRYSAGFNPHQIMSFAQPLGLGITSDGEYMDIEVNTTEDSKRMIERINAVNVQNIVVYEYRLLPDKAKNGMSIIAAADYEVRIREGHDCPFSFTEEWERFISQDEIIMTKTTKKGESEWDIRPYIYDSHLLSDGIFLKIACGSVVNLKPEVVMEAFYRFMGYELGEFDLVLHRKELYADLSDDESRHEFITLSDMGKDINKEDLEELNHETNHNSEES